MMAKQGPEILLHPLTLEPLQHTDPRYKLIYLIMQDEHVSEQRKWYDLYKDFADLPVLQFLGLTMPWHEKIFILILRERFDSPRRMEWERQWFLSATEWLKKDYPICTICGIYSIGDMCRDTSKPLTEPYLIHTQSPMFDYLRWLA